MKRLIRSGAVAAIAALAFGLAQTGSAQNHEMPKAGQGMSMACPMMGDMASMHADMSAMMSDLKTMMKDSKDTALKEKLEGLHKRMSTMVASMQKMSDMHAMMMGGMGKAHAPDAGDPKAPPQANSSAPVSPEDHKDHHPVQ